jgi:hypothetical protein
VACETCKGKCCNGESGNIWVNGSEIAGISTFLGITSDEFIADYLRKIRYRFTLKELKTSDNYACVFFDPEKNGCSIYEVRPSQCKSFPFWDYFIERPDEIFKECPGCAPL